MTRRIPGMSDIQHLNVQTDWRIQNRPDEVDVDSEDKEVSDLFHNLTSRQLTVSCLFYGGGLAHADLARI